MHVAVPSGLIVHGQTMHFAVIRDWILQVKLPSLVLRRRPQLSAQSVGVNNFKFEMQICFIMFVRVIAITY